MPSVGKSGGTAREGVWRNGRRAPTQTRVSYGRVGSTPTTPTEPIPLFRLSVQSGFESPVLHLLFPVYRSVRRRVKERHPIPDQTRRTPTDSLPVGVSLFPW